MDIYAATHDIADVTVVETEQNAVAITTRYSILSNARGALFIFASIDNSGDVDFTRSVLLALDRETSHDYTLPFSLSPGGCRVFVYDIEHDATLPSGVSYPAVRSELTTSGYSQGAVTNRMTIPIGKLIPN